MPYCVNWTHQSAPLSLSLSPLHNTHSTAAKLCSGLKLIWPEEKTQAHHKIIAPSEIHNCCCRCRRATCPDLRVPTCSLTQNIFFAKATSLTAHAGCLVPALKHEWWSGHCEQNVGQPQLWGDKGQKELKGSRSWLALHHFWSMFVQRKRFPNFHHMHPHQ